VTAYEVEFRTINAQGNYEWKSSADHCSMKDGKQKIYQHRTNPQLLYCKVPMSVFWDWGLDYDELAVVRVRSENVAGYSEWSTPNTYGAEIENVPATMGKVQRDTSIIDSDVIAIKWERPSTPD